MLEHEKKILITQRQYEQLRKLYPDGESFTQTNFYYDSDDLKMNRQGITCRIRQKNGECTATIKAHRVLGDMCSAEELQERLPERNDDYFRNMNLRLKGCLTTYRTILYADDGIEIVLDKNTYLGMQDYELEIEYKPESEQLAGFILLLFQTILSEGNHSPVEDGTLDVFGGTPSKSERFFGRIIAF